MEPFRFHVYVCDQQKPEGVPCCSARGSAKTIDILRKEIASRGLLEDVQVTVCGSLGLCERGPNMVVYPEGVWYSGVTPGDVAEIVEKHFRQGQVVERLAHRNAVALRAEVQTNRNKTLAVMRAKDAAGVLPDDVSEKLRAFQESRVLLTAVELDVFTAAGDGSSAADVASKLRTDLRATEILLNALVAIGMLAKCDGRFSNTPTTARFFTAGSPEDARLSMLHTVHLWDRWSSLTACVRAGTSVRTEEARDRGTDWTLAFIAAMHRNAADRAALVVEAVGVQDVRRMLDVGGGSGAYSIAFAQARADLQADLLDLETVVPIAQGHIDQAGLGGRICTRCGDLRTDRLGEGYDLVFVSAICHMLSVAENRALLNRCAQALAPGGRVAIQDFILESDKTSPKTAALFSLNMLVGTRAGASYSELEYAAWLREAGFGDVKRIRLPGPSGLIVGKRL